MPMNAEIIPAVMPNHFDDIEASAALVKNSVTTIQLDLMDGKYVSEKTWPFYYSTDYDLTNLLNEDGQLPFWEEVNYELDLMVTRPEESLDTWLHVGASRVIFHYASINNWKLIKEIDPGIRNFIEIGCAITIHDDLPDIIELIKENTFDFIQVMGIAHIGYQGEPFEESIIEIIDVLKNTFPDLIISVDGGVSLDTVGPLADGGVTRFVSGSAVFAHGSADENIEALKYEIVEGE